MYKIIIHKEALHDIQAATDWYNEKLQGLGSRFQKQVKKQINSLKKEPTAFSIRYADVRCMLIRKFPFLVHFTVNKKSHIVEVFAIIHTSGNPIVWEKKKRK